MPVHSCKMINEFARLQCPFLFVYRSSTKIVECRNWVELGLSRMTQFGWGCVDYPVNTGHRGISESPWSSNLPDAKD